MKSDHIGREARRRALQRMQLGLSARAAGADDGGSASDAMRAYTDSIDLGSGPRERPVALVSIDDERRAKRRGKR